jgi:hypothetical protein
VFGKLSACTPTVFRWQWPNDIRTQLISNENTEGTITNSDLEMAGLLLLWLTMEGVCRPLQEKSVAMFGDNSPSISWVERLASKQSLVAENLAQALALRLKIQRACPLTTIHIAGRETQSPMSRLNRLAVTPRGSVLTLMNYSPCPTLCFLCQLRPLGPSSS